MALNESQLERYKKSLLLNGVDEPNQESLLNSNVLIIGAGGLGSPISYYLTAAGVGNITIIDPDTVDTSNLQRQILHSTDDLGEAKVISAKNKLTALNPDVTITPIQDRVTEHNIESYIKPNGIKPYNIVIDATDTYYTKLMINDACVIHNQPLSHGGALGYIGHTLTIIPPNTSCLRCLWKVAPMKDDDPDKRIHFGTFPSLPGVIGTLQAQDCLKYLLGLGNYYTNETVYFHSLEPEIKRKPAQKNPHCAVCGTNPLITSFNGYKEVIGRLEQAVANERTIQPVNQFNRHVFNNHTN